MAANYLHGVETIELEIGNRPISVVKSAVIALIGIAPIGGKNEDGDQALTIVQNERDAAAFGKKLTGFNIPKALDAIFKQGAGTVVVVNIWDESEMATLVTDETVAVENRTVQLDFAPVGATPPVVKNNAGTTTYVAGTDYTIDEFGKITILAPIGTIAEGDNLKITYKKLNAAGVTTALLIGEIDGTTGKKTGLKLLADCYNTFGFTPKILISPEYSELNTFATEMIAYGSNNRAYALIDAPLGTTVAQAIAGRGPAGAINFNTSSKRAILCLPHVKEYDVATDSVVDAPYSQYLAGVIAATDNNEGYWVSPSNHEIKGIVGLEYTISAAINDANTDANLLNEKGIVTVFNSFGSGFRVWGNRSAAFPSSTHPSNFICVQRTADILNESVELAMLQFIDKPINQAIIDSIRGSVNAFIRTLVGRGALIDGECTFDRSKNPVEEIAAGHITFDIAFMPPVPAERITFDSYIDIELLKTLA